MWKYKGFDNALNYKKDVLAVAAFDGEILAGLAGADNYMDPLYQIGIDTIAEYRNKGIAAYLVSRIVEEITTQGKIPYYTTWSANLASIKVALSAGFKPVWIEYFAENIND